MFWRVTGANDDLPAVAANLDLFSVAQTDKRARHRQVLRLRRKLAAFLAHAFQEIEADTCPFEVLAHLPVAAVLHHRAHQSGLIVFRITHHERGVPAV